MIPRLEHRQKALLLVVVGIALIGTGLVLSADVARYSAEVEATSTSTYEFGSLSDRAQNVTRAAYNVSINDSEADPLTLPRDELPPPYSQESEGEASGLFESDDVPPQVAGDFYFLEYDTPLICVGVKKIASSASVMVTDCLNSPAKVDGEWYYSPVQSLPNEVQTPTRQAINDSNNTAPIRSDLPAGFTTVTDAPQFGDGVYLIRQGTTFYTLTITYPDGNGWFPRLWMLLIGETVAYAGVAWLRPEFRASIRTLATAKGALLFVGVLVVSFRVTEWVGLPLAIQTVDVVGSYGYGRLVAWPLSAVYNVVLALISFEALVWVWGRLAASPDPSEKSE